MTQIPSFRFVLLVAAFLAPLAAHAGTFTVSNTDDDLNAESLRTPERPPAKATRRPASSD